MVIVKSAAELENIREDLANIFVANNENKFGFLYNENQRSQNTTNQTSADKRFFAYV